MSTTYLRKNRKKFNLKIHLILVCKYRKKLLISELGTDLKNIINKTIPPPFQSLFLTSKPLFLTKTREHQK